MSAKRTTKLVYVGDYVAEVEVEWIEPADGRPLYLSLADTQRLDAIRELLRRGDLETASQYARVTKRSREPKPAISLIKEEMKIGFDNIFSHAIPMDNFMLKWRFTDEKYECLPDHHLEQLVPLDAEASRFVWDYILNVNLFEAIPFKRGFFRTIDKAKILEGNEKEIKKWLYQRGLPFDKYVFLSWQPTDAMIVPWKLLIKYFDSFYHSGSDDLAVIDQSLTWALLFYHAGEIYFGTNKDYKPSDTFADTDFIW